MRHISCLWDIIRSVLARKYNNVRKLRAGMLTRTYAEGQAQGLGHEISPSGQRREQTLKSLVKSYGRRQKEHRKKGINIINPNY